MVKRPMMGWLLAVGVAGFLEDAAHAADSWGEDAILEAVRIHGYECERPAGVERDAAASRPEKEAWLVTCANGRYRVIFEGDTGSRVEPVS